MKGKITIGSRSSHKDGGVINISIEDRMSGLGIIEGQMTYSEFAQALTGLAYCDIDIRRVVKKAHIDNLGCKKITRDVFITKPKSYAKDERKQQVLQDLTDHGHLDGPWMLWDDGCSSQQNGDMHRAVVYMYAHGEKE